MSASMSVGSFLKHISLCVGHALHANDAITCLITLMCFELGHRSVFQGSRLHNSACFGGSPVSLF
jgi:type IV secretory pathway VirB3-like protein